MAAIGLNTSKIEEMKQAIKDYKQSVDGISHVSASAKDVQKAIKGTTVENDIKTLTDALYNSANSLLATLDRYVTILDEAAAAYKANDESSTSIKNVTDTITKS